MKFVLMNAACGILSDTRSGGEWSSYRVNRNQNGSLTKRASFERKNLSFKDSDLLSFSISGHSTAIASLFSRPLCLMTFKSHAQTGHRNMADMQARGRPRPRPL